MILCALLSTCREGHLSDAAIRSALAVTPHVFVYEGPAGMDPEGPETNLDEWEARGVVVKRGRWKSDADKRTAMLTATRQYRPEPVWGVWIDGDEVLVNGEYLIDYCRYFLECDEYEREQDPDAKPRLGWPIMCVEMDGATALSRARVIRCDLIDGYSVSSSVFKDTMGNMHAQGAVPVSFADWWQPRAPYMLGKVAGGSDDPTTDRLILPPPLPCQPFIMHRSALRHPKRQGSRLHQQEPGEIARVKRELGH